MTILNQIAIVKNAKHLKDKEQEETQVKEIEEKKEVAQEAQKVPELALQLEEKLKDFYKQVQTKAIKESQKHFSDIYLNQTEFTKQFYQAINERQQDEVLGVLWVLAEKGKLIHLLAEDKKIQSLYDKHLTKKYGDEVARHFLDHNNDPAYLSYFLQHLLVDTLKMSGNDSAALAIHLFNEHQKATGQEVEMLAYGDMESQQFKWRKIVSRDGKLVMEKD